MNNEGWGLRIMVIFVVFAGIVVFVCISALQNILNLTNDTKQFVYSKNYSFKTYRLLEEKVADSADKYYEENDGISNKKTITIDKLLEEKYLNRVIDIINPEKLCSGYVVLTKTNNQKSYKTYLDCPNYVTEK